jgi:hypothetical protein
MVNIFLFSTFTKVVAFQYKSSVKAKKIGLLRFLLQNEVF